MDGSESEMSRRAQKFGRRLEGFRVSPGHTSRGPSCPYQQGIDEHRAENLPGSSRLSADTLESTRLVRARLGDQVAVSRRIKILVIAPSVVSERMAGPNIRAIALARELAARYPVTLAVPCGSTAPADERLDVRTWSRSTILRWLSEYDVVVSVAAGLPVAA